MHSLLYLYERSWLVPLFQNYPLTQGTGANWGSTHLLSPDDYFQMGMCYQLSTDFQGKLKIQFLYMYETSLFLNIDDWILKKTHKNLCVPPKSQWPNPA